MARDEMWDALKEHSKQVHKERVAKNSDRIQFAIQQFEKHNIEYLLKMMSTVIFIVEENQMTNCFSFGHQPEKFLALKTKGVFIS